MGLSAGPQVLTSEGDAKFWSAGRNVSGRLHSLCHTKWLRPHVTGGGGGGGGGGQSLSKVYSHVMNKPRRLPRVRGDHPHTIISRMLRFVYRYNTHRVRTLRKAWVQSRLEIIMLVVYATIVFSAIILYYYYLLCVSCVHVVYIRTWGAAARVRARAPK